MTCPDLKIGLIVEWSDVEFEIMSFDRSNISIKILKCNDKHLNTYVDLNKIYSGKLSADYDNFKIWVINEDELKRTSSQLLIGWSSGDGFDWELDF